MTDVWTCWLLRGSHRLWRHSRVARSSNFRHCRLNVEVGREFVEDRRRSPPYPSSEPCRSASGCMRSVHIYFRSRWSSRAIRRAALTTNEVTRASHMHYDALPTRRVRVCKIGLHEKLFKLCQKLAFDKRQFVCLPRCESVNKFYKSHQCISRGALDDIAANERCAQREGVWATDSHIRS